MTQIVGPSWWRPHETAHQHDPTGHAVTAGTSAQRHSSVEQQRSHLQSHVDSSQTVHALLSDRFTKEDSWDSEQLVRKEREISSRHHQRQNNDGKRKHAPAYIPVEHTPGTPLSFRQILDIHQGIIDNKQNIFVAPTPSNSVGQLVQRTEIASGNPCTVPQKTVSSPRRETPCRFSPLKCTPHAVSAPQDRRTDRGGPQAPNKTNKLHSQSQTVNEEATDRLGEVEKILEQLIHEAKVLRIENTKLRAARKDLRDVSSGSLESESVTGEDLTSRLKCEVSMLRRKLREQDEKLKYMLHESAYMDTCRRPNSKLLLALEEEEIDCENSQDENTLRARLLCKEESLRKSEEEAAALRAEVALLKSSDKSKMTELEELRAHCKDLKCQLLAKQREFQSCIHQTASLAAEAAAAKGAQVSKAWEFEQMERRIEGHLRQQVEDKQNLQSEKQEAKTEVERLRAALRSAEERALCQTEQLQDRNEEVQLLQQRVNHLCSQRAQDAAKIREHGDAMVRWRAYIRFLEKLIRDLRVYIDSQASASAGILQAARGAPSCSSAVSDRPWGPLRLQQAARRASGTSKEQQANLKRRQAGNEMAPDSLAAVGYNLIPLPLSPYEPCLHHQFVDCPDTPCKMPPHSHAASRRQFRFPPSQSEGSASIEQLGRLMKKAAEELRATAAAARNGQSPSRHGGRSVCCTRPALGRALSPGSTEASSIGGGGDTLPYLPCEGHGSFPGGPSEFLESGRAGGPRMHLAAHATTTKRPFNSDRGCLGYDGMDSLTSAGSFSEFSVLMRARRRERGNCRWLSKGPAAAKLAEEISVRFPMAFDRLQKSVPSCQLLAKK